MIKRLGSRTGKVVNVRLAKEEDIESDKLYICTPMILSVVHKVPPGQIDYAKSYLKRELLYVEL